MGRNSTLILGITPDPCGLVPEPDVQRMKEFGDEMIRRFGKPSARTEGIGNTITLDLASPSEINQAVIMEDIALGERIRKFTVEEWKKLYAI